VVYHHHLIQNRSTLREEREVVTSNDKPRIVVEPHCAAPSVHGRQSCWSDHIPHRLLDAWWCQNQPDVRLRTGLAREKSLVQLLAHRACHRAVPESMVTELHGRLRWWQCGRQQAAQTGRAMHNALPTCARNSVDSEALQRFLIAVVHAWKRSEEGDTDWGVGTDGLLHVLGVPLAPESASTLQLQSAKLPDAEGTGQHGSCTKHIGLRTATASQIISGSPCQGLGKNQNHVDTCSCLSALELHNGLVSRLLLP
jgi:hypothetical protein